MINTPAIYKKEMLKPYRNPTYVQVDIGVVNNEAQRAPTQCSASAFPDPVYIDLNNPYGVYTPLAMWDQKGMYVSGEQYMYSRVGWALHNYGWISSQVSDDQGNFVDGDKPTITVKFSLPQSIYGVTYTFDQVLHVVAKKVTVQAYHGDSLVETKSFTNTEEKVEWFNVLSFNDITKLVIIFDSLNMPGKHLRVAQTVMGIGFTFDKDEIEDTDLQVSVDPLSGDLPSYSFTLTLNNRYNTFDFEDPDNLLWFIKDRQKLQVTYTQMCAKEDGSGLEPVRIPGGIYIVNEPPEVNESTAVIKAVSILDYLDFQSDGTSYLSSPVSLADLATARMNSFNKWYLPLGIDLEYQLDSSLANIMTTGILPPMSGREELQYIANAAMVTLYVSRDNKIIFRSAVKATANLTSENGAKVSRNDGILEGQVSPGNFAAWPMPYFYVEGTDYLFPVVGTGDVNTGYISAAPADTSGVFRESSRPKFTVKYSGRTDVVDLTMHTAVSGIKRARLVGYLLDDVVITQEVTANTDSLDFVFEGVISSVDRVEITVLEIFAPSGYLIVKHIDALKVTNYTLLRSNTSGDPTTTVLNPLSAVQVVVYQYTPETEEVEIARETYHLEAQQSMIARFDFNEMYADINFTVSEGRAPSDFQSASYIEISIVNASDAPINPEVVVKGKKVVTSTSTYTLQIRDEGGVEKVDNPLITSLNHAAQVAEWIAKYAQAPKKYTVPFRGDTSLEALDLVYYETKRGTTPLTTITEMDLQVGLGMSGSLTLKEVGD